MLADANPIFWSSGQNSLCRWKEYFNQHFSPATIRTSTTNQRKAVEIMWFDLERERVLWILPDAWGRPTGNDVTSTDDVLFRIFGGPLVCAQDGSTLCFEALTLNYMIDHYLWWMRWNGTTRSAMTRETWIRSIFLDTLHSDHDDNIDYINIQKKIVPTFLHNLADNPEVS